LLLALLGFILGSALSDAFIFDRGGVNSSGSSSTTLTTFTVQNTSGATQPSGTPISFGQAFRRGDVPSSNNCVQIRDAATHNPLATQLNEIATRRENSDDGSIGHLSDSDT
jgi:hypothetical protein